MRARYRLAAHAKSACIVARPHPRHHITVGTRERASGDAHTHVALHNSAPTSSNFIAGCLFARCSSICDRGILVPLRCDGSGLSVTAGCATRPRTHRRAPGLPRGPFGDAHELGKTTLALHFGRRASEALAHALCAAAACRRGGQAAGSRSRARRNPLKPGRVRARQSGLVLMHTADAARTPTPNVLPLTLALCGCLLGGVRARARGL